MGWVVNLKAKVLLFITLALLALSSYPAYAQAPGVQDMHAYIAGNPSNSLGAGYQGYGFAYPISNYSSVLPVHDLIYVNSLGNSTVYVEANSTVVLTLSQVPSGYGVFNITLPQGTYMIYVTISSSYLGKSVTEAFSVDVLSPTLYKSYISSKISSTSPAPSVSPLDSFGMGLAAVAITVLLGTPVSYVLWNRHREKKGAVNVLDGIFGLGGKRE